MDSGPQSSASVSSEMESESGCISGDNQSVGDDFGNDAEGVWSADIEQSFQEALAIYPPCGRRKIILSDEGKMYGRNELIARYIKMRTGKSRSRKQVSSHIQVLARRKSKEIQANVRDPSTKEKVLQSLSSMSSSQIVSANALHPKALAGVTNSLGVSPGLQDQFAAYGPSLWNLPPMAASPEMKVQPFINPAAVPYTFAEKVPIIPFPMDPPYRGRSIAGPKLRIVEFSAFQEQQEGESFRQHLFVHINSNVTYADPLLESVDICQIADKFPNKKGGLKELFDQGPQSAFFLVKFWADINSNMTSNNGFYGISSLYESDKEMVIQCSTKVCSFGKQVVEKVETEYAHPENCHYVYRINRSPMCEYLINFIHKLKTLPEKYMMNSVLENFTILQVVAHRETQETLLCIAYVFEVSTNEHGAQHTIYKLVKES